MLRRSVENLPAWAESRVATQSGQGSSSRRRDRGVPRRADATARRQPAGCGVPRRAHSGATLGQPKPPYAAETRRPSRCLKPARFQRSRSPPKSPRPSLNPKVEGSNPSRPMPPSHRFAFLLGPRPLGADWLEGCGTLVSFVVVVRRGAAAPPASCWRQEVPSPTRSVSRHQDRQRRGAYGRTTAIPCASAMSSLSVRRMPRTLWNPTSDATDCGSEKHGQTDV